MNRLSRLFTSSALACVVLLAGTPTQAASAYSALFVFGDSLSDSGNNALLPQVGASASQVISGNNYVPFQTYGSGTYSNGAVWATQFADMLGLPLAASVALQIQGSGFSNGANFAFGGATTSGGDAPSLLAQSGMYLAGAPAVAVANSALYVVAGGGNNVRDTLEDIQKAKMVNPDVTDAELADIIDTNAAKYAADISAVVNQLQGVGAQHIIVWNTPNLGLSPQALYLSQFLDPTLSATITGIAYLQNQKLATALMGEKGVLSFDIFNLQASLPAGTFTNTTDACGAPSNSMACPIDISKALYWDGLHPTSAAQTYIANQMLALTAPVPEPSEVAMLLAGMLVVAGFARSKGRR